MKLSILAGATSQSVNVFVRDSSSTTGAGLTGLAYNTASLTAYYSHAGANATATAITLATLAAVNGAYSSGGFKEIDATNMPGWYRFDIPNACLATSKGRSVAIHLKGAANMAPLPIEIELTGWDNQDSVRAGLTALPNAAAEAAGGLYTRGTGAGQIKQTNNGEIDSNATHINNVATTSVTAVNAYVGSTGAAVNGTNVNTLSSHDPGTTLGTSTLTQAQVTGGAYALNSASFAFNAALDLTTTQKASVNTEADTALADYDAPTYTELLNFVRLMLRKDAALATDLSAVVTTINADLGSGGGAFASTTDSQEAIRDRGDTAWTTSTLAAADVWGYTFSSNGKTAEEVAVGTYNATASLTTLGTVIDASPTSSSFQSSLSQADTYWNDALLVFRTGNLAGQARPITSHSQTNGLVTFDEAFTTAPANGDAFSVTPSHIHPVSQIASTVWTNATRTLTSAANITSTGGTTVPQTGDSFARIGATGSGLTSLAPASTALSTVQWTNARAGYLDNINNAALATTAAQTGDAYAAVAALSIPTTGQIATAVLTTQMTESYRATGAAPTLAQACFEMIAHMGNSAISGTTKTLKKLDGSTTAKTFTLDDASTPTSITEAT